MFLKLRLLLKRVYNGLWLDVPSKIMAGLSKKAITESRKEIQSLLSVFKPQNKDVIGKDIILIAEVRDIEYILKMAALSKVLADKYNCVAMSYNVYIERLDNWHFSRKGTLVQSIVDRVKEDPLKKMYSTFTSGQLHNNSVSYKDQAFIIKEKKKIIALLDPNNLGSINKIQIENILVGDLIYDTYLRFFHQPTILAIDEQLKLVIEWALNIYYTFKEVLNSNKIRYLISTYTAYIHFGITARLCLERGIKVYTVGSSSYRLQLIDKEFPYHPIDHSKFDADKNLDEQLMLKVKDIFEARFEGKIDGATSYMRESAFVDKPIPEGLKELFQLRKRNIVIYVHDFYDSPHVNRELAFPDLYQFLSQTLKAITDMQDTTVFIKTHPNGIAGCKEKTIELVNSFQQPGFIILDEAVSNLHIIELKPDLIATARGTVCVEMAYFGIPTVALYDNVFANFKFTHTCYNLEEYFNILKGNEKPNINYDKEKILSFYYQAYLEKLTPDKHQLFSYLTGSSSDTYSDEYADYILDRKEDLFSAKLTEDYIPLV
jgi:hypothetical protein